MHFPQLVNLLHREPRRVVLHDGVQIRAIDDVGAARGESLGLAGRGVGDHVLESIAPQDLPGQVRRSRLHRVPRRLDDPLQGDDHFEAAVEDVLRGHRVERAGLVDLVEDGAGQEEQRAVVVFVLAHGRDFQLFLRKVATFAFAGLLLRVDDQNSHVRLYKLGASDVSDSEDQIEVAVSRGNDRVFRKYHRVRPILGNAICYSHVRSTVKSSYLRSG